MIDIVLHRKRQFGIGAVDRRGRREEQMFAAVVAAAFQHVDEAFDIRIDIGVRIFQRITNAGLGSEMNDDWKSMLREQRLRSLRDRPDRA